MRVPVVVLAILLSLAQPALSQERDPASRQALVDLSYALGQAHALRQLCNPGDQRWRQRMLGLVDTEAAGHEFAERLRSQFNTGYVSGRSQFADCSPEARLAESRAEARGADLARRIAGARINPPPAADAPAGPE